MTQPLGEFSDTITIEWKCYRHTRECNVDVEYTFDGEELHVTRQHFLGNISGLSEDDLNELVREVIGEDVYNVYAEWLEDGASEAAS